MRGLAGCARPRGACAWCARYFDELVAGVEQFLLVDAVVAVEDGAALVAETASVRRQAPRNVASILDSARELGIRDAQMTGAIILPLSQAQLGPKIQEPLTSAGPTRSRSNRLFRVSEPLY